MPPFQGSFCSGSGNTGASAPAYIISPLTGLVRLMALDVGLRAKRGSCIDDQEAWKAGTLVARGGNPWGEPPPLHAKPWKGETL